MITGFIFLKYILHQSSLWKLLREYAEDKKKELDETNDKAVHTKLEGLLEFSYLIDSKDSNENTITYKLRSSSISDIQTD